MVREYVRHGSSITVGTFLIAAGYSEVQKGNYLIGAVLCIIGAGLILINYVQGQVSVEKKTLSRVREWL